MVCLDENSTLSVPLSEVKLIRVVEGNYVTCGQGGGSKRQEVKLMLKRLRTTDPEIEERIFQALHHVQWETFPRAEGR